MTRGVKIDCSPFYKKGFVCFKKLYLFYKGYKKQEPDSQFYVYCIYRGYALFHIIR